jgi:hypothetical protein
MAVDVLGMIRMFHLVHMFVMGGTETVILANKHSEINL